MQLTDCRFHCPVYTREEPDLIPRIELRHAGGRLLVQPVALELRPVGSNRYQLHVLNVAEEVKRGVRKLVPGASRGVYTTLPKDCVVVEQLRELGVTVRGDKPRLVKSWKPGIVTIRTGPQATEEVLGSVRRCYGIHKTEIERLGYEWTDPTTGEKQRSSWREAVYRLTHLPTGKSVWAHKRRSSCEEVANQLEESIPELADLIEPFPPEILVRLDQVIAVLTPR